MLTVLACTTSILYNAGMWRGYHTTEYLFGDGVHELCRKIPGIAIFTCLILMLGQWKLAIYSEGGLAAPKVNYTVMYAAIGLLVTVASTCTLLGYIFINSNKLFLGINDALFAFYGVCIISSACVYCYRTLSIIAYVEAQGRSAEPLINVRNATYKYCIVGITAITSTPVDIALKYTGTESFKLSFLDGHLDP